MLLGTDTIPRWGKRAAIGVVAALGLGLGSFVALDAWFPPRLDKLNDVSVSVTDSRGHVLRSFMTTEESWRLPASVADVPPFYLALLKSYEDRRFDHHYGVDPWAVLRATGQALVHGRVVSGASTLTMQVARLLEPRPRTLRSKLIEMFRAVQLERRFTKDEILGMYLTLAPYGGNVEGIRAASLSFFGKEPRGLTPAESALLVALPQAPSRLRPDRWDARAREARDKVLDRGLDSGVIDARHAREAQEEAVARARRPFPIHAPHLAQWLRQEQPTSRVIPTTIDGGLQRAIEALAAQAARQLHERASVAVLVVENRTRAVRAYVGSPDFFAEARNGQIDMVQAPRSPGSTLKPFVYGLGFDDHIIHPETVVADIASRFGEYAPENFDRQFHGELTVREALQRSLNIPAVAVLDRLGALRFAAALRTAGARLRFPAETDRPGLPVILGGVGINLWDLVSLYTGLANGGEAAPIYVVTGTPAPVGQPLLSPEATAAITKILAGVAPLEGFLAAGGVHRNGTLAFKTGTSYGFRDALSIGYSPSHTVGVWAGRPDGTPSPDHFGRNTALPLLFQVFDILPDVAPPSVRPRVARAYPPLPEGLRRLTMAEAGRKLPQAPDLDRLQLLFPPSGAALETAGADGTLPPIGLQATGGRRPLVWLVNGRPIPAVAHRREVAWQPEGIGFYELTVIDADGRSASSRFQIR